MRLGSLRSDLLKLGVIRAQFTFRCFVIERFEEVGDVRGRGYFIGIEFVRDRVTKQPFPAQRAISHEIGRRAFENGLICYPCAGNAGDGMGDTIIVAPPFNATDAELVELVEKLEKSVGQVLRP